MGPPVQAALGNYSAISESLHPYYPLNVEIVGYLANEWTVPILLSLFATGCTAIFGATFISVKILRPGIPLSGDLLTIMWFVLSGCIHLFFEGYYAYNFKRMGGLQDLFGQLWKEYSLSDSRYMTNNSFVLCMETITAFCWGPLSFVVAWTITTQHVLRYPLQIIVSLGQLYGDVLYYGTSMFDHYILDISYSRPEAFYFWGYYVLMNAFWIVIPFYLIWSAVSHITTSLNALDRVEKTLKRNTLSKKGQ
ncbi:Emopamil-binding protein [Aulographum hederae CBS 113979]|uniref:Emopamil-binding protein n=1 Tax=Aulographum hederae CBS 113979 TaxID=1176131 RepID=A0A6G1H0L0_9PEZI|nr:Emopamil-binding protein [Aulographum hederae CBS 113979]